MFIKQSCQLGNLRLITAKIFLQKWKWVLDDIFCNESNNLSDVPLIIKLLLVYINEINIFLIKWSLKCEVVKVYIYIN